MAQLCRYKGELDSQNVEVLTVFFSNPAGAPGFLSEVCSSFPLLFDPDRAVYRAYGLQKSWLRLLGFTAIQRLWKRFRTERRLRGIQGAPSQMGGDFIIDTDRVVRLAHPSKDPADRITASEIMRIFRTQKSWVRKKSSQ